jgi:nucleotide-binding universal stress UspA family protein
MKLLRLDVVLAAIDYDDASQVVLDAARALGGAGGADVHVVHVVHVDRERSSIRMGGRHGAEESPDSAVAVLEQAHVEIDRSRVHVIAGEPASVMCGLAERLDADVIVLGPHREHLEREGSLGGTALAIATEASAPCLIVTRGIRLPLRRVLVPIDLSDTARGALAVALAWSSALRGVRSSGKADAPTRLTAMFVDRAEGAGSPTPSARHALEAELDRVRQDAGSWAGVEIHGVTVASTDAAGAIADRANADDVDLIVLGTRGLGLDGAARLGSVSADVSRRVDMPVLLVPPAVWRGIASGK